MIHLRLVAAFYFACLAALLALMPGCGTASHPARSAQTGTPPSATASDADAASDTEAADITPFVPVIAAASDEGVLAIKKFTVPPGFKADLWAAEPLLANPVAIGTDAQGRWYVCETFRHSDGALDIRGRMNWLDEELASRSVEERGAIMRRHLNPAQLKAYRAQSERLRRIEDTDGDGRADRATVFAEHFNRLEDGIMAGVLPWHGDVFLASIPNLWRLRDTNNDGVADERQSLHHGYGVRAGFIGHDLHGLRMGPDGKLYFSIGDRGLSVTQGSRRIDCPESGAVLRCDPDGANLELVHVGLRNPQELAFDDYGNLFTGDNNSDGGDQARWVYLVEGGDSGWRIGWQFINQPNARGPWMAEKMDKPLHDPGLQPAHILPPILNIGSGPSGLAYYPGTGLPGEYNGHFFLCDFRGSSSASGVHCFTLQPNGATFKVDQLRPFAWNILCTDADFGVDGGLYIADWVEGWNKPGKGRIYRVHSTAHDRDPLVLETQLLLREGMGHRAPDALNGLLAHADQRVRQEAQFALASRGLDAVAALSQTAARHTNLLARIHAIWALGQVSRQLKDDNSSRLPLGALLPLLKDPAPEIRAQAAKGLGDGRFMPAQNDLVQLARDPESRVRFFAAAGLGKLGRKASGPVLIEMLRANADQDPYLRHAAVMALAALNDLPALLEAGQDSSPAVRMGSLLALRRLDRPEIARFLKDQDLRLVQEAARAVNDGPIEAALPELASLIGRQGPEALHRRILNANFRLGGQREAEALARFALAAYPEESLQAEAVRHLGDWAAPSGRDAVTGLWRPIAPRNPGPAATALRENLSQLLGRGAKVQIASIQAAQNLGVTEASPDFHALVKNPEAGARVRIAALQALAGLKDPQLPLAIRVAQQDSNESLRNEANRLQARSNPEEAVQQLQGVLRDGSLGEKQAALATLAVIPGAATDAVLAGWMDQLLAGSVAAPLRLDVLEAASQRESAGIKDQVQKFESRRRADDPMRSYRESLEGGNAEEGRRIFYERLDVFCSRCHKIGGEGGEAGPDLTGIGSRQNREYLLESILLPNQKIALGFETIVVTLNNGGSAAGILVQETDTTLELNSPEDGPTRVRKADIKTRGTGLSGMPEELRQLLSRRDARDLVEFLSQLR